MIHILRLMGRIAALVAVATVAAACVGYWYVETRFDLPDHHKLATLSSERRICSPATGRVFTPFSGIPPRVRDALLAAENPGFFAAPSTSLYAEVLRELIGWESSAGLKLPYHGISSQVARCLLSASEGWTGNALDWHLANFVVLDRIERETPRQIVFETFANESYFGQGAYGVAAAAESFFGKPLSELTLDEAAFLGGVVKAPDYFLDDSRVRTVARRDYVLDRMAASGFISAIEAGEAKNQPLAIRQGAIAKP